MRRALESAILKGALVGALFLTSCREEQDKQAGAKPRLLLYCGAGIRTAAAEIVEAFEKKHGVVIETDYAGSNILLSRIKLSGKGDLYMPGEAEYVRQAAAEGLVASSRDACYFVPVILVRKGNPK
ncbi:MAG: substrate-binding domain-containing protein, partial [bacterium]|nr:substrate-binding domain-containing protein [bacterium]